MLRTFANIIRAPFRRLRALSGESSGAVAMQFAILVLPLTILSFALFDIGRASIAKQRLQDALDAAGLLAARSAATDDTGLTTVGSAALRTNIAGMGDTNLVSANFHINGNYIDSTATVRLTPIIANLWMTGDMTVTATSQVARGANHLEIALVLDNTGSMAQNLGAQTKISALRTAAQTLVSTIAAGNARGTDPNAVKIAVVPFSMTVNVGSEYRNASWMSGVMPRAYGDDIFTPANTNRFTLLDQMGMDWAGCVESRPAPYDIQDTAPSAGTPATLFVPYFAPDEPDDNTISYTSSWGGERFFDFPNNYITSDRITGRGSNLTSLLARQGQTQKYAASNMGYLVPGADGTGNLGPNRDCRMAPIMRLTTDVSAVNARLGSMVAVGNTNVPMGLVWGWHVLSPNAPFADGASYATRSTTKIVVLLTDGDNTNSETSDYQDSIYTGIGYIWQRRLLASSGTALNVGSSGDDRMAALDDREARLCSNMKAQGITIFAIGVGVSDHSRGLLRACASGSDHYYDVTDASQLNGVFTAIVAEMQTLRISH